MKTKMNAKFHSLKISLLMSGVMLAIHFANAQCDPQPSGLVAWWRMDGTPNDVSGTNNPSATNAISYVTGKVGLGVTFGNGGYIDFQDSVTLANQAFSFVAWAMPNAQARETIFTVI